MNKIIKTAREIITLNVILPILFFAIIVLIFMVYYSICVLKGKYGAYDFTKKTGYKAQCNIALDCYVFDNKWIPYSVWKEMQVNSNKDNHLNIKLEK